MLLHLYLHKGSEYLFHHSFSLIHSHAPTLSSLTLLDWKLVRGYSYFKRCSASKWDAALLSLLSRKQSHLLSLTLCCPASSALQSTEDGTEITIMQRQGSQFHSRSHISTYSADTQTYNVTHSASQVGSTCTCTHNHKCNLVIFYPTYVNTSVALSVSVNHRIPLDSHR